jgi:hypothetical protein
MKKFYASLTGLLLCSMFCLAQNVAINEDGSLPDPSAMLDIKSGNKGILIPRMSTADRELIVGPKGLMVYDTTTSSFWYIWLKTTNAAGDSIAFWKNLSTGTAWSLSGNAVEAESFLGTTNNAPLKIRVFNQRAGLISKYGNTFWGFQAGFSNPENGGTEYNTGIGNQALYSNTGGNVNSAFGHGALSSNTEGHLNTAIGSHAMDNNTTGDYNTAIGYNAMYANTTGSFNTAIGDYATVSSANISNATAIGDHAWVNASNKIRLGSSFVTVIEGQVPFTTPSDGRFKFEVKEDVKGLDFILQLRPVTYQFDAKRFDAQLRPSGNSKEDVSGIDALQASYDEAARIRRSGFIAQEVEKAAIASGYNFSGIIQPKTTQEHYSLSYEAFVVPLVKAVQEQQQTITAQNKILIELQQQLNELKQLMQRSK